jgi:hypothetical protein
MTEYYSFTYKDLVTKRALIPVFIISIALTLHFISLSGLSFKQYSILNTNNNHSGNLNSPKLANLASNILCCLVRLHGAHLPYLPVLALGLSQAGFDKIHLYVVSIDKGIDRQLLLRKIEMINTITQRVDYISLLELGEPEPNDAGYSLLDRGLTYLYNQSEHSPTACEYVLPTNADNFYSSQLGRNVLSYMDAKTDVIVWDFITPYDGPRCTSVSLGLSGADLGSAAYRVAFLKQHKLHYNHGNRPYDGLSDGHFFASSASISDAIVFLRETLFVHQ